MVNLAHLELVKALTQSVFPGGVAVEVADPRKQPLSVDPTEAACVANAVPQRRFEFHAGRRAARAAMSQLGVLAAPVPSNPDRSPLWPDGLVGSLSHNKSACVAVVGRSAEWASVGVDLEEDTGLAHELIGEICTPAEQAWLKTLRPMDQAKMAKLIFCAKEAAYKAQYPLTQALFGFDRFEVTVQVKTAQFEAKFQETTGRFQQGTVLAGRYAHVSGIMIAGIALPQAPTLH